MMFSLSCSWNSRLHNNGADMIREIKDVGIDSVELNFLLTQAMVDDVIRLKDAGEISVVSVHNFCPMPDGVTVSKASPDYFNLASLDEEERSKAVYYTRKTIELAKRVQARCVILHCGRVEMKDRSVELFQLKNTDLRRYNDLKKQMTDERRRHAPAHLDSLLKSLFEVNTFAKAKDIMLGMETRYYHREIPSMPEIGSILDLMKDSNIYYWHDVGHAQACENLGFGRHIDFLKKYNKSMIGLHLHDIIGIKDHKAPLEGNFNFEALKPYVRKDMIFVLEPHQPSGKDKIKAAIKYLEGLFTDLT